LSVTPNNLVINNVIYNITNSIYISLIGTNSVKKKGPHKGPFLNKATKKY